MKKRMIFTLSPGRCGTKYLAKILESIPGIHVEHEGQPDFSWIAKEAQNDIEIAQRFWLERKLPYINSLKEPIFVETSHVFNKGFAKALLKLDILVDVIILTRPHRQVALSRWRRNSTPGRSNVGLNYLIHPGGDVMLPLPNWQQFDDYQLIYWYCLEVEKRCQVYAREFARRGSKVHRTSLNEIVTENGFLALVKALELPEPNMEIYRVTREWRLNFTPEFYNTLFPLRDLDEMEGEVTRALAGEEVHPINTHHRHGGKPIVYLAALHMGTIDAGLAAWLEEATHDPRYKIISDKASAFPVMNNRSKIWQKALHSPSDFLLMIDDDVIPNGNLLDLVEKDLDIVGFPTPIWRPRDDPLNPVKWNIALANEHGRFVNEIDISNGLIEVTGIGTGAMLIARRVLEHPDMQGAFVDMFDDNGIRLLGGDFHFCAKALDAGFKIWAAMDYLCGHKKRIDLATVYGIIEQIKSQDAMPILMPK